MGKLAQVVSHDRLVVMVGAVLLAGGLVALWFPVFLGDYDRYGIQVKCGNGYSGQLLQATVDDQQSDPGGAPAGVRPAVGYVDRCQSALADRRAWAIPTAGLGALTLTFEALAWAHRRAMAPGSPASTDTWSEAPDDYLHEAARLDRQGRPYRERPSGTTL
jgi:hypothetical protein